jgi:hypothetical protein
MILAICKNGYITDYRCIDVSGPLPNLCGIRISEVRISDQDYGVGIQVHQEKFINWLHHQLFTRFLPVYNINMYDYSSVLDLSIG